MYCTWKDSREQGVYSFLGTENCHPEILSIFSKDKEFLAKTWNELDLESRFLRSLCSLIQATGLNKWLQCLPRGFSHEVLSKVESVNSRTGFGQMKKGNVHIPRV